MTNENLQNEKRAKRSAVALLSGMCLAASAATAQVVRVPPADGKVEPATPALLAAADRPETTESAPSSSLSVAELPEAPGPQLHKLNTPPQSQTAAQHISPLYSTTIPAGYQAQTLNGKQKFVFGLRDSYSFISLSAIALSAGYSHLTDGQPNFGVNSKAFAQRLGSSAVRETSQNIFSESIMAPLLHEDPRYYIEGPSYNPVHRTIYAITRPLITRTDSGNRTVNAALLIGYAGAAALTPTYYPQSNRNFHDVASTFGASIGGVALGNFLNEFTGDVLTALHLRRTP